MRYDDFGAQLDVGVVDFLEVVGTAVGGGEVVYLFLLQRAVDIRQQFFEVVVEDLLSIVRA